MSINIRQHKTQKNIINPRTCKISNLSNTQLTFNPADTVLSHKKTPTYCDKNDAITHSLIIYHQNIQGLKSKTNELMLSLLPEVPHLICLSEHHLKQEEIDNTHISLYKLGANYCRTSLKCGGVCIFLHGDIIFFNINLLK